VSGTALFIALFVLVALVVAAVIARRARRRAEDEAAEDTAQARRWVERLAGQVERVPPRSEPARRSMEAAEDRLERARGMLPRAAAPADAVRIHETAIEGLHYVRAAHEADGDPPGAPLPPPSGARTAGAVDRHHTTGFDGRTLRAAPRPAAEAPYYFPGGRVRGRPVPRGWYSEPWWQAGHDSAGWPSEAADLFDALLAGDPGIPYDGADFEAGYGADPVDGAG